VLETEESLRLAPTAYGNLSFDYIALDRLNDAEKVLREAQAKGLDGLYIRGNLYLLAFRRGKGMEQQLAWAAGRAGDEDAMLSGQPDTEAYYGRLVRARDYSRRASESAVRAGSKETAALWQATAGFREAEFENTAAARQKSRRGAVIAVGTRRQAAGSANAGTRGGHGESEEACRSTGENCPDGYDAETLLPANHSWCNRNQ
jgi:hypothetical protein